MTNDYLNIDVPRGLPPQSKKPALLSLASILAAYNAIVGDSQNASQPSEYKFDASAWNDPKYYPAYAAKEEGDAE